MAQILLAGVLLATIAAAASALALDARQRRLDRRLEKALNHSLADSVPSIRRPQTDARWSLLNGLVGYQDGIPYEWGPRYALLVAFGAAVAVFYANSFAGFSLAYAALAAVAVAVLAVRSLFGWQRNRFLQALFHQLPDTIEMVTSAVRSGLPVNEAFRAIAYEMQQPTAGQFAIVCSELAVGKPVEEAMGGVYRRTGLTEYGFFAVTLGVQIKAGGSLAETLQTLADTVRQRVAMAARAKALAAEVIFSARALSIAPVAVGGLLYAISPDTVSLLFTDPTGQKLLMFAAGSVVSGNLVMRWMIRRETS